MQDAIRKNGSVVIHFSQCEHHLRLPAQFGARYRLDCWLLVHNDLLRWVTILWRCCSRSRGHVPLQCRVPGTHVIQCATVVLFAVEQAYRGRVALPFWVTRPRRRSKHCPRLRTRVLVPRKPTNPPWFS